MLLFSGHGEFETGLLLTIKTDHSAIKIEFKDVGDGVKGPGLKDVRAKIF